MNSRKAFLGALAAIVLAGTGGALAASDASPTFDQILQAPDDVNLNLAYAKAEANNGHLLAAAAALERILMARPNAVSVRLLYIAVLYRLDDLPGARAQLNLLGGSNLTPLQQAELEKYRRRVNGGSKGTRITGNLAAGFAYDSDAQGALLTQFDNLLLTTPRQEGTALVVSGKVEGSVQLGTVHDLAAYGSLAGYSRTETSGPDDQLQDIDAEIGLTSTDLMKSWKVGAVVHHYRLFGDPYLTEIGAREQMSWRPNTATTLSGSFEIVHQDFDEPLVDALAPLTGGTHDGWDMSLQGNLAYRLDANSTISAALGYERKTASYRPFSYDAPFVQGGFHALLGRGTYLDVLGNFRWVNYRDVDRFFLFPLAKAREDTSFYARAAFGVPLSAFTAAGATGDALEDIALEAALTYSDRNRPLPLADYHSTGAELRVVWHFGDDR